MKTNYLVGLFKKAASTPPKTDPDTGNKILFHSLFYLLVGIVSIAIAGLMIWIALFEAPPTDENDHVYFILMILLFTIGGVAMILEWYIARVIISETGIVAQAPWPWYPKKVSWIDIERVSISIFFGSFIIISNKGNKIRISPTFYGIKYLVDCFKQYLDPKVYIKASRLMQNITEYSRN